MNSIELTKLWFGTSNWLSASKNRLQIKPLSAESQNRRKEETIFLFITDFNAELEELSQELI